MADARRIFDEILAVRRAHAQEQPKEFVLALVNSGNLASRSAEYHRYLELAKEARQFSEQSLGALHPWTLEATKSLATAYSQTGDAPSALPLFELVLDQRKKLFGDEHRSTLISALDLATALDKAGQFEKSLGILDATYQLAKSKLGQSDELTANALRSLALVHLHAGNSEDAIRLGQQLLDLREKTLGAEHPSTSSARNALVRAWFELKQFDQAEELCRKSLEIATRAHPDHWQTSDLRVLLGSILMGQGRFQDARPLLEEGLKGLEQRRDALIGEERQRIEIARQALAELAEHP
jgi:tetratricopeptide (TPR) repeat protein